MQLAQVQGRATATIRHPSLAGVRLLVCQMLGITGQAEGDPVLVIDKLGAGMGDRVMITSDSKGLRSLLGGASNTPARWWTLGIVDQQV